MLRRDRSTIAAASVDGAAVLLQAAAMTADIKATHAVIADT